MFSDELCDETMFNITSSTRGDTIKNSTGRWVAITGVPGSKRMIDILYTDARRAEVAMAQSKCRNRDMCPEGHVSPPTMYCPRREGADGGWINGRRCTVCTSSRWEQIIYACVQMLGLTAEKCYLDGYELDIYIPELRRAIEYNGEQHYKKGLYTPDLARRIYVDQQKLFACNRADIKLLFVRFDDQSPLQTVMDFLRSPN